MQSTEARLQWNYSWQAQWAFWNKHTVPPRCFYLQELSCSHRWRLVASVLTPPPELLPSHTTYFCSSVLFFFIIITAKTRCSMKQYTHRLLNTLEYLASLPLSRILSDFLNEVYLLIKVNMKLLFSVHTGTACSSDRLLFVMPVSCVQCGSKWSVATVLPCYLCLYIPALTISAGPATLPPFVQ